MTTMPLSNLFTDFGLIQKNYIDNRRGVLLDFVFSNFEGNMVPQNINLLLHEDVDHLTLDIDLIVADIQRIAPVGKIPNDTKCYLECIKNELSVGVGYSY